MDLQDKMEWTMWKCLIRNPGGFLHTMQMNENRLTCIISCAVEFLYDISYNYVEIINNIES